MSSTYSTNLALELMATGDQDSTWGDTTNTNLGTLLEQAISGYVTQAITNGADTVITIPDGASGVARNMYIELTGALTAARNLIVPANKKLYFIYNNTTGGFPVVVKTAGTTGISVPNGYRFPLVSNGVNMEVAISGIGGGGGSGGLFESQVFTATQGQTVFIVTAPYVVGGSNLAVFVNGSKQIVTTNYTETNSTTFTFLTGLNVGDLVQCVYGSTSGLSTNANLVVYNEGSTGAVDTNVEAKLQEFISVGDFIPVGTTTYNTDCSAYFTAALDAVIAKGGGTLWIPYAVYKVNLDWSAQVIAGGYNPITILGNNSVLLGVTGATSLLKIDIGGSGDNYLGSSMSFYDISWRTESNVCNGGTAVIPFAVQILRSSANWYNCNFQGGSTAAYYSTNCQYSKFFNCNFVCSGSGGVTVTPTNPCAGMWIQSSYNQTLADQIVIQNCNFGSEPNGLYIDGATQLKVLYCRFQDCRSTGTAAIRIGNTLDGAGSEQILISGCHFEVNQKTDIYLLSGEVSRVTVSNCLFANPIGYNGTKVYVVESYQTNQSWYGNDFRTASAPNLGITGNLGQLNYLGNDVSPTLDVTGSSNPQAIIQNTTNGSIDYQFSQLNVSGFWGRPGFKLAGSYLWVDSSGRLRIKTGSLPSSDTDGTVVGTQT